MTPSAKIEYEAGKVQDLLQMMNGEILDFLGKVPYILNGESLHNKFPLQLPVSEFPLLRHLL